MAPSAEEHAQQLEHSGETTRAARSWASIGRKRQREKLFAESRAAYYNAVRLDGSQHGCLANLAQLEADAGNLVAARDFIQRAVALNPTNSTYGAFCRWL